METQQSASKPKGKASASLMGVFEADGYLRIENWYKDIEEYTFKTEVFDFGVKEAKSLASYKQLHQMELRIMNFKGQEADPNFELVLDEETVKTAEAAVQAELSEEEKAGLASLKKKLKRGIKNMVKVSGGAFVKTSSRSPKDAVFLSKRFHDMVRDSVMENIALHPDATPEEAQIEDMIGYVKCCTQAMKVTNADEAIDLFLNSTRTRDDIGACMLQNGEENFDMKIIVREWKHIQPEWEFRAFIFNNVMTSITQYWSSCYVPQMKAAKEKIGAMMKEFWSTTLKPLIKIEDYTIDFVIDPSTWKMWVIELNPSPPAAGQSLFSWENSADRKVMQEGPFEFRILENPVVDPFKSIHSPARRLIGLLRGNSVCHTSHTNLRCDLCRRKPITEVWYSCKTCGGSDICRECANDKNALDDLVPGHIHCYIEQRSVPPNLPNPVVETPTAQPEPKESKCILM